VLWQTTAHARQKNAIPELQRQQMLFAQQALHGLWQRDDLAQILGKKLGGSEVLLGGLPENEGGLIY
jgi:hypothetical protein